MTARASNGGASMVAKVVMAAISVILSIVLGALTSWLFKLDDRVFDLSKAVAAQVTTQEQLKQVNEKIDAMSEDLHRLIGAYEGRKD